MGMIIFAAIIAVPAAIAVWLTERVDRPRRAAMRDAQVHPAE
jgi:HAMP domain-containing protein